MLATALALALLLTRPEWALLTVVLLPYVLVVLWRRGLLDRRLFAQAAAAVASVLLCVGAYSVANQAVNGYFGLTSVLNVALMGKVMVYRMEGDAPAPYDRYTPLVASVGPGPGPWPLTKIPPFDDRNHVLEGQFARAVITHRPIEFARHVLGTLVDSPTDYNAVFIRIGPDGGWLREQLRNWLHVSEARYAAFVLLLPFALAWAILGLVARPQNTRAQIMGVLAVIALYASLTAAATTFDEFGRVHMPINPISTVLVFGTLLLNARSLVSRPAGVALLAGAALVAELGAIYILPGRSASVMFPSLLVILLLQFIASGARLTAGLAQGSVDRPGGKRLGGDVDEGQRERRSEPGHAAAKEAAERRA